MVNTLSGSVCAYRKETVKPRFIRIDEVMALLDVTQDEAMDIALAAGARYQLAKIILVHKERLMKFMKHSARVPSSNKIVEKKFVRIGEGSMTYSIGHHRFIEMARAAGAVYKIGEAKEIEEIMDDVRENDQCLFFVGVTIILMAESKKELESVCETVETIGKRNSCTIDTHYLKQREALNTALPIGVRQVETMRTLLTQSLAVLMPFNVQELNDSTGNYYGINQISKNVNIGNRKKLINGNGFVFGVPGSGKSFFCKMEMGSVFLSGDDEIIVIDPMNEYFDIAETYGGTVVNMSTYTDNYVNPLEMDVWSLDPNDSKGMVREKGEFMLGLCEQCIGDSLNSRQKGRKEPMMRFLQEAISYGAGI